MQMINSLSKNWAFLHRRSEERREAKEVLVKNDIIADGLELTFHWWVEKDRSSVASEFIF